MRAPKIAIPAASNTPRRTVSRSVTLSSASVRSCLVTNSLITNCLTASAWASACSEGTPLSRRKRAKESVTNPKTIRLPASLSVKQAGWTGESSTFALKSFRDFPRNLFRRRTDRHRDRVLVASRFLQCIELALEQGRRHKVTLACLESRGDQVEVALEINEPHVRILLVGDDVTIDALQRRARHDAPRARRTVLGDVHRNCLQPRPAVFIRQRLAAAHLLDVGFRMKAVG